MKQHQNPHGNIIHTTLFLIGFLFLINPLKAQLTLEVTINSGQVTTTCTDNFGDPDPRFRVSVAGNALVTYPATDFCFTDLPNTQYVNTQACGNAIPTVVEICLRAFEDDGSFCNISPDCQEEICQDFIVPAPNTSVDYTLTMPTGLSSWGEVNFTLDLSGTYFGAPNDLICDAINMGVLTNGGVLGDATTSNYVNYCATGVNEPNTAFSNEQSVWFSFTTSPDPVSTTINLTSDPSGYGDPIALQFGIYESDDGTCNGNMTGVFFSSDTGTPDEMRIIECLEPNTNYFMMIDGGATVAGGVEGFFGVEISDLDATSAGDVMCEAENLGAVPDGGLISVTNQSNICSDYTFNEPWTSAFVPQRTVWYQFTIPASGHIIIDAMSNPDNPIGIQLALFTSNNDQCTGFFSEIGTNYTFQDLDESLEMQCLEPGEIVWLLIDGDGTSTTGVFDMNIIDGGDIAPQSTTQINEVICAGQTITIGGEVFDASSVVDITVPAWNNCDSLITGTVTVLPPLSSIIDTTICFGQSVTVGGTDYAVAGIYSPTLITADGCDSVVNLSLAIIDDMTATAAQTLEATGYQTPDGEATVVGTGGAGNFTYEWSDGQTSQNATNLIGGQNYCVTITDGIGCTAEDCVLVLFPSNILTSLNDVTLNCPGDEDGSLNLSISNGAAPYDYSWENLDDASMNGSGTIATEGGNNSIDNLPAGSYSFTISDAFGITIAIGDIIEPAAIFTNIDTTLCAGETLTVGATVFNVTSPINVVLPSYLGCDSTIVGNVEILTPIETVLDETLCFGEVLVVGSVVYNTSGPINEVLTSYTTCDSIVTGSLVVLSENITTIDTTICFGETIIIGGALYNTTGVWTDTETAFNTCDSTIVANLIVLDELVVSADITSSATGPGIPDGEITANLVGGQGPFTYLWSDSQTSQTAINLIGGQNYCVTVTDNIGCIGIDCVTVDFPSNVEVSMSDINLSCNGDTNGSLTIDINLGQAPYGFVWQNQDNSLNGVGSVLVQNGDGVINNLPPGTYYVTVTDVWGQADATALVIEPEELTATVNETATSCFGECDGSVGFTVTGGTPPYQFAWPTGQTGPAVNNLCAGIYLVTVSDANNCEAIMSTVVLEPDEVIATAVEVNPVSCFNGSDGAATVSINGTAQSYLWDNGETTQEATNLDAGVHTVVVIDANACSSTASITINQPADAVAVLVTIESEIACFNGTDGALLATATGGSGGYTYEWSSGDLNAIANTLTVGQYIVTVTDITGCTTVASGTLTEPNEIFADLTTFPVTCPEGISSGTINVDTAFGGMSDGYTYSLDGIYYGTDTVFNELIAGIYNVFVQDLSGCAQSFEVEVDAPEEILLELNEDQSIRLGESTEIESYVFNSNIIYDWTANSLPIDCPDCDEIEVTPVENTLYQLTVLDTLSGCTATAETSVEVILERNVFMPNAFSPNGDGVNDLYFLNAGPEVQQINYLRIFNRWGALVYESREAEPNDSREGWNGQFKGKAVATGVYIVMAQVEFIDGEVLIYEGDVSVLR